MSCRSNRGDKRAHYLTARGISIRMQNASSPVGCFLAYSQTAFSRSVELHAQSYKFIDQFGCLPGYKFDDLITAETACHRMGICAVSFSAVSVSNRSGDATLCPSA
jgi:hypothetical protein